MKFTTRRGTKEFKASFCSLKPIKIVRFSSLGTKSVLHQGQLLNINGLTGLSSLKRSFVDSRAC